MLYLVFEYLNIVSVCRTVLKHRPIYQDLMLILEWKASSLLT